MYPMWSLGHNVLVCAEITVEVSISTMFRSYLTPLIPFIICKNFPDDQSQCKYYAQTIRKYPMSLFKNIHDIKKSRPTPSPCCDLHSYLLHYVIWEASTGSKAILHSLAVICISFMTSLFIPKVGHNAIHTQCLSVLRTIIHQNNAYL